MIFHNVVDVGDERDGGPPCAKCGSTAQGISTVQRRDEFSQWGLVTICEPCIFKAVLGDTAFQRAVNSASQPLPRKPMVNGKPMQDDVGEVKKRWWEW